MEKKNSQTKPKKIVKVSFMIPSLLIICLCPFVSCDVWFVFIFGPTHKEPNSVVDVYWANTQYFIVFIALAVISWWRVLLLVKIDFYCCKIAVKHIMGLLSTTSANPLTNIYFFIYHIAHADEKKKQTMKMEFRICTTEYYTVQHELIHCHFRVDQMLFLSQRWIKMICVEKWRVFVELCHSVTDPNMGFDKLKIQSTKQYTICKRANNKWSNVMNHFLSSLYSPQKTFCL